MGQVVEAGLQAEHQLVPLPWEAALGEGDYERSAMGWSHIPLRFGVAFLAYSRLALQAVSWACSVPYPAAGGSHGAGLCAAPCQVLGGTVPRNTLGAQHGAGRGQGRSSMMHSEQCMPSLRL